MIKQKKTARKGRGEGLREGGGELPYEKDGAASRTS